MPVASNNASTVKARQGNRWDQTPILEVWSTRRRGPGAQQALPRPISRQPMLVALVLFSHRLCTAFARGASPAR
jgi:hypothetical protein